MQADVLRRKSSRLCVCVKNHIIIHVQSKHEGGLEAQKVGKKEGKGQSTTLHFIVSPMMMCLSDFHIQRFQIVTGSHSKYPSGKHCGNIATSWSESCTSSKHHDWHVIFSKGSQFIEMR